MCGDEPGQDLLARLAQFVRPPRGEPVRRGLAAGSLQRPDAFYAYMDEMLSAVLTPALNDLAAVPVAERDNLLRSQSIVFARIAGLLAAQLGGRDDFIRVAMEALLEGYGADKGEAPPSA